MSIKVRNIKFHENPTSQSRADTCKQTDKQTDGQMGGRTDMAKLIGAFCGKGSALENSNFFVWSLAKNESNLLQTTGMLN
jgi:hypothetical protein